MLKKLFSHPLTRRLDIDAPRCTKLRSSVIQNKAFLRQIYINWYKSLIMLLPPGEGPVLELGSGSGFLKDFIPNLLTSDIFQIKGIDFVLDGQRLPFKDTSLQSIVMVDVLHHIPDVTSFLAEAARCIKPGGLIVMVEPWVTRWSALVYRYLHHEPYHPETKKWDFAEGGPLSQANLALPWIIFARDRKEFERRFPKLRIQQVTLHSPFCYLLSGGVSLRSLLPGCLFETCRQIENMLMPWMGSLAMFATIALVRVK